MACIGLLTLAAPALGQRAEAQKLYDSIFKAEEDAAAKTLDKKDDVEFAAKLLKYAGELSHEKVEDRELKTILLLKAFEFGVKDAAGAQTATDAMELLRQVNVELKDTAQENILKVRQMLFEKALPKEKPALGEKLVEELMAAGDERLATKRLEDARRFYDQAAKVAGQVKANTQSKAEFRVKVADSRIKTVKEIDTLKAQLQAKKAAETARKLVLLNLVEMDDVEEAARFLDDAQDEALKRIVGLCNRDAGKLTAAEALELGDWFRPLVKTSSDSGKAVSVSRARSAYEQYMKVQTARNAEWLRAKVAVDELTRLPDVSPIARRAAARQTISAKALNMKLAWIPPGSFWYGSPAVQKTLACGFYMQTTEVTQAQWFAVMGTRPWAGQIRVKEADNCPATYVGWDDAVAFCKKLSEKEGMKYRLPTEEEWECACRAGTSTKYSFGDDESRLGEYAWYNKNAWDIGEQYAHAVATKKPNAWGLYDMHGNVWEWCSDWYDFRRTSHVMRGGVWDNRPDDCRAACRHRFMPDRRTYNVGFRVCLDAD
jgi:formylglycine-generating enzyme required for sulfatase activity